MPERIQRKRTKDWRLPEGAACVTRPGKWGNPFKVGEPVQRDGELWPYLMRAMPERAAAACAGFASVRPLQAETVVEAYGWWFLEQPHLMLTVAEELGGRDLACYCKPGATCHGDFLLAAANGWETPDA